MLDWITPCLNIGKLFFSNKKKKIQNSALEYEYGSDLCKMLYQKLFHSVKWGATFFTQNSQYRYAWGPYSYYSSELNLRLSNFRSKSTFFKYPTVNKESSLFNEKLIF